MFTSYAKQREAVALHEAAHAAVCMAQRVPVSRAAIHPYADGHGGLVKAASVPREWLTSTATHRALREIARREATALLASAEAEVKALGIARNGGHDEERARELAQYINGNDDLEPFREAARALLDEPIVWRTVAAVATELVEKGKLSGEELGALWESAGGAPAPVGPSPNAEYLR